MLNKNVSNVDIHLDRDRVAPGGSVSGTIGLPSGHRGRRVTIELRYTIDGDAENRASRAAVAEEVRIHDGDDATVSFSLVVPPRSVPGFSTPLRGGPKPRFVREWTIDVTLDRPGRDWVTSVPVHILPSELANDSRKEAASLEDARWRNGYTHSTNPDVDVWLYLTTVVTLTLAFVATGAGRVLLILTALTLAAAIVYQGAATAIARSRELRDQPRLRLLDESIRVGGEIVVRTSVRSSDWRAVATCRESYRVRSVHHASGHASTSTTTMTRVLATSSIPIGATEDQDHRIVLPPRGVPTSTFGSVSTWWEIHLEKADTRLTTRHAEARLTVLA